MKAAERAVLTFCSVTRPCPTLGNAWHKAQPVPMGAVGPPAAHKGGYGGGAQPCLSRGGGRHQLLTANKMPFKNGAKELNWPCFEPGCCLSPAAWPFQGCPARADNPGSRWPSPRGIRELALHISNIRGSSRGPARRHPGCQNSSCSSPAAPVGFSLSPFSASPSNLPPRG